MNKIHWHQGLFLQPQHFEFLEQSLEDKINFISQNNPYLWGVKQLEVDEESLFNNELKIDTLKVIFKDMSILTNKNSVIMSKMLDNLKVGDNLVYIGIQKFNNDSNVEEISSFSDISANKRFVSDINGYEMYDLYDKDEKANIRFLKYVVKIFLEDEIKNITNYELIPILSIKKEDSLEINEYVPPILNINDNITFKNKLKKINELLIMKINNLNEYKLPFSSDYSSTKYMKFLVVLQILNRYACEFSMFFEKENTHPFEVYRSLRKLVAEISVFSNRIDYLGRNKEKSFIHNYNHISLSDTFDTFEILLEEVLDEIIIGPEYMQPLQNIDNIFQTKLEPYLFEKEYNFYLIITPTDFENFDKSIEPKISSKERIDVLIHRALEGVKIKEIKAIEGIPIRKNVIYAKIDTYSKEFQEIRRYLNIAIFIDDVSDIELIAMKG